MIVCSGDQCALCSDDISAGGLVKRLLALGA
jgi:hypothetical protein